MKMMLLALAAFAAHRSALLRPHPKKERNLGDTPQAPRQLLHFLAGALDGTG
jgi:hypothetical protein